MSTKTGQLQSQHADIDLDRIVHCFESYLVKEGLRVTRAQFEANLLAKLEDETFAVDVDLLITPGAAWSREAAAVLVLDEIAPRLTGEPWKGLA